MYRSCQNKEQERQKMNIKFNLDYWEERARKQNAAARKEAMAIIFFTIGFLLFWWLVIMK